MYGYEGVFSGVGWWNVVDMIGLFASLCYD